MTLGSAMVLGAVAIVVVLAGPAEDRETDQAASICILEPHFDDRHWIYYDSNYTQENQFEAVRMGVHDTPPDDLPAVEFMDGEIGEYYVLQVIHQSFSVCPLEDNHYVRFVLEPSGAIEWHDEYKRRFAELQEEHGDDALPGFRLDGVLYEFVFFEPES